jgi:hypothetical protein
LSGIINSHNNNISGASLIANLHLTNGLSSTQKHAPPSSVNLQKSHSKAKNQGLFDRSGIAYQTGLTLTSQTIHKLTAATFPSTLTAAGTEPKQISLPSINNNVLLSSYNQQQYQSAGSTSGYAT